MIEKIQEKLKNKFGRDVAYYLTCGIYIVTMLSIMFILSYIYNNFLFAIIATLVINLLRAYTYGYHEHELFNCIILTNILFLIFGFISKGCPLWMSFLLCCFCVRDLYLKAPLGLNFENKNKEWHRSKIKENLLFLFTICLILLYFNKIFIVNCILQSIIMVDLLLFKNID